MNRVEYVSYDGKYPNLCYGDLIVKIDGEEKNLGNVLVSGGCIETGEDWDMWTVDGEWSIDFPNWFPKELMEDTIDLVNENVPYGCCGGCI